MPAIWCELRSTVMDGMLMYRGLIRAGNLVEWRGRWHKEKSAAIKDAERAAEQLYRLNSRQLTFAATADPWHLSRGLSRRQRQRWGQP